MYVEILLVIPTFTLTLAADDSGPYYANGGGYLASSQGATGSPGGAPKVRALLST